MLVVPLQPVPDQVETVQLGGQSCRLRVFQMSTGLYADIYINDALVVGGVACLNANRLVRAAYLGFVGDLAFFDTQGSSDPDFTGLGDRFILMYLDQ